MSELTIQVRGAEAVCAAAAPTVALCLELSSSETIQTVVLHSQIQIEAPRRRYSGPEQARLRDLFGEPERWGQTLHALLWANLTTTVPGFTGSIGIKLAVPCTFDLNVTASKYFHGVEDGDVPLTILFSGTMFYRTAANQLQAAPIPWNTEARFALPVAIWKQSIDLHHPNTAWLGLRRDVYERLHDFKVERGLASFDEALERMMEAAIQ